MAERKAKTEEKVIGVDLANGPDETVLVFRPRIPLTEEQHKQLAEKIRFESDRTGVKIVLMPYSCELIQNSHKAGDQDAK